MKCFLPSNKLWRIALAGALGGFVGWVVTERWFGNRSYDGIHLGELLRADAVWGLVVGLCIGLLLGSVESFYSAAWSELGRDALAGAAAGAIGGAFGLVIGELVYQAIWIKLFVGRAVGWGVVGAVIGFGQGVARRSVRGITNGALGGMLGGAVGGIVFDLAGLIMGGDALSRALTLTILGASVGLLISYAQTVLSPATLTVVSGRMEGRQFLLDKPKLVAGSGDGCDIGIHHDGLVRPHHAEFVWGEHNYALTASPDASVQVNGQPRPHAVLEDGDVLTLGETRMVYRMRRRAERVSTPARSQPDHRPASPHPVTPAVPAPQAAGPGSTSASAPKRERPWCGTCRDYVRAGAKFCTRCGRRLQ